MKAIKEHLIMLIIAGTIGYFLHIAFCEKETIIENQKTIIENQDKLNSKFDSLDKFLHEPIEATVNITKQP